MINNLRARRAAGEKGFTLVELLVVIVVLGILAAVVVFAVGNIQSDAQKNACVTEKDTIKTAIQAYRASTGHTSTDDPAITDLTNVDDTTTAGSHWTLTYTAHAPTLTGKASCNGY